MSLIPSDPINTTLIPSSTQPKAQFYTTSIDKTKNISTAFISLTLYTFSPTYLHPTPTFPIVKLDYINPV